MSETKVLFLHYKRHVDGGEETIVQQLIEAYSKSESFKLKVIIHSSNNQVEKAYNILSYYFGFWRLLYISLVVLLGRYKCVHVSNYFPFLNPIFIAGLRVLGAQIIVHFHNHKLSCPIGTHWTNNQNCFACLEHGGAKNVFKHKCKDNLISRCVYYVNYIIDTFAFSRLKGALRPLVLTRWYEDFLRKQKGFNSLVLYNTISGNIREYRCIEPNEFSFIYIGRDSESKGYSDFLKAAIAFPDIQFVSVGPKRKIDLDNLKEYGWMSREETYRILGRSSCLVAPYKGLETFGMTVLESLALGVPVITTNIYSVDEVFSDMKGVYIYSLEESLIYYIEKNLEDLRKFGRRESLIEFDRVHDSNALENSLLRLWKI